MKIGIITSGRYPVPAVKGGAVSTLTEYLVYGNSLKKLVEFEIISPYDDEAEKKSHKYKNKNSN